TPGQLLEHLTDGPHTFQLCNIILPMCLGAPASGAYGLSRQAAPRMSAAPRQRGAPPMWPYYNPYAYGAYHSWYQPHYSGWYGRGRPFGLWPEDPFAPPGEPGRTAGLSAFDGTGAMTSRVGHVHRRVRGT